MSKIAVPFAILAELTHRCPLRCPYCSNPVELVKRSQELDTQTWMDVITQAAEMGVLQVHFSGGEPTVRNDLEQLIAHAQSLGLYSNLITAGVLVDSNRLAKLADAGLAHVQLSVQDSDPKTGDWVSGLEGSQVQKYHFAKLVEQTNLALTANIVIHRHNIDRVGDMIDMAVKMRAQRVEVANVQYYGWGIANRDRLMPTLEQLKVMDATVKKKMKALAGIIVFDYVVPDYYARLPKACMNGWGRQFLNISPEGEVLPCHAAETIPDMQFENVKDTPLLSIWESSEAFNRFRGTDWMPEPCQSCDRKEIDWAGCRCQALALTGSASNPDPACEKVEWHDEMREIAIGDAQSGKTDFNYRSFSVS